MGRPAIITLSVIIPCFNEAPNVDRLPETAFPYFSRQPYDTEYILVDDGSTDETARSMKALSGKNAAIKVISHEVNRGLGAAVISGLQAATGDAVVVLDADMTFDPAQVEALAAEYGEGVDCVVGSPSIGQFRDVPFIRRLMSNAVNRIYGILLGRKVTAASSIFRLYRRHSLLDLNLQRQSFDINAEILFGLIRAGRVVREVPVVLGTRRFGVSKINVSREIRNHLQMFVRIIAWRCRFYGRPAVDKSQSSGRD